METFRQAVTQTDEKAGLQVGSHTCRQVATQTSIQTGKQ